MRLDYIRSFINVVNCKSFSVAAKKAFVSQPTISTHIKQLESELGVQLLVRSTKDVILSEEGVLFYPYAVRLLETEYEALAHLNKTEEKVKGTVTIAASSVPGNYILPRILKQTRLKYSEIDYRMLEGDSSQVIQSVLRFEANLGIGSIRTNHEKCMCMPLLKDQIVLATPNTEEYRSLNGVFPLDKLKKETFVVRESGSGTKIAYESIEKALNLHAKPLKIAMQAESSDLVRRSVEEGMGVAFVSSLAIQDSIEQGKILKFEFANINTERQIYLMYHKDRIMTLPVTSVIKSIRQQCQKISG